MNRKKNSSKKLSDTNLLKKAPETQATLTERLDNLLLVGKSYHDRITANEHATSALRHMVSCNVGVDIGKDRDWSVVREYARQSGKTAEQNTMVDMSDRGRLIMPHHETFNVVRDNQTVVSTHRESIDKIEALAVSNGRAQVAHERNKNRIGDLEMQVSRLTINNEGLESRTKNLEERARSFSEQYHAFVKLHNELIAYLEPKARSKRYYNRHVDARNMLKRLRGEK